MPKSEEPVQNCGGILFFFISVFSIHSAANMQSFINRKKQIFLNGGLALPAPPPPPPASLTGGRVYDCAQRISSKPNDLGKQKK